MVESGSKGFVIKLALLILRTRSTAGGVSLMHVRLGAFAKQLVKETNPYQDQRTAIGRCQGSSVSDSFQSDHRGAGAWRNRNHRLRYRRRVAFRGQRKHYLNIADSTWLQVEMAGLDSIGAYNHGWPISAEWSFACILK